MKITIISICGYSITIYATKAIIGDNIDYIVRKHTNLANYNLSCNGVNKSRVAFGSQLGIYKII